MASSPKRRRTRSNSKTSIKPGLDQGSNITAMAQEMKKKQAMENEVRAWVEKVIMDRVWALHDTRPGDLNSPKGVAWAEIRETLRSELQEYGGALSITNLRGAVAVLS